MMENKIKIPTYLYEVHGRKSNWLDIISTHLLSLLTVGAVWLMMSASSIPLWQKWTVIAIAYDLGGGVFSHFTRSIKEYYTDVKQRLFFLFLHFLHPMFLVWIFPQDMISIAVLTGFASFSAFAVSAIPSYKVQVSCSVLLSSIGLIAIHLILSGSNPILQLLLTLYLLKLVLSFAVRWPDRQ